MGEFKLGQEFLDIKEPQEVEDIIRSFSYAKKKETVQVKNARDRILATDIKATIPLPPFTRAAMDGYAVKAEDTFSASEDNPKYLKLVGSLKAGEVPSVEITSNTCIEIGTGAPLPPGADGVVMVEYTQIDQDKVAIYQPITPGQNITLEGSDVKKGEIILEKDTLLTPKNMGVLSAIGLKEVQVYLPPRVAVMSTGDELIGPDEELEDGQIYDINSLTISSAVESCGCVLTESAVVKDEYDPLKKQIMEWDDVDVIISSGGTSAGKGDMLRSVLDEMGEVLVHGVALKPGKPTIVATINQKSTQIFFGLPGYPVAALIVFYVFVAPFLRRITGFPEYLNLRRSRLKLSRRYRSTRGRNQYVLVRINGNSAEPIIKDSGAISALAKADGYFYIPKNVELIEKGSLVEVYSLSDL